MVHVYCLLLNYTFAKHVFYQIHIQIPMNEENKHVWVQHVVDDVKKNKKKSANRALVWPCRAHRADDLELSPTQAAKALL